MHFAPLRMWPPGIRAWPAVRPGVTGTHRVNLASTEIRSSDRTFRSSDDAAGASWLLGNFPSEVPIVDNSIHTENIYS
eukprot:768184-Hanusia_phi.AAC.3